MIFMNNIKLEEKLKAELSEEKIKFIQKYSLEINSKRQWITRKNNTPERLYFSHKFILRNNILEIVFRKYQLCFAKLKYFRANIEKYDFYKHTPKENFIKTELWDAEFFYHKQSGTMIDFRYLQQIRKVEDFLELIEWLDSFEMKKNEK